MINSRIYLRIMQIREGGDGKFTHRAVLGAACCYDGEAGVPERNKRAID